MAKIHWLPAQRTRHHWTDWVGFLFCLWLAGTVLWRSPRLGMMLLPICLHDVVAGVAFLVRQPAKARLEGWGPRLATYGSTFLVPAFLVFAGSRYPYWVAFTPAAWAVTLGYCVWLVGVLVGIWTVWRLRRSFSLAPQARELVRAGPYRLARHPIYSAYALQYLGMWTGHFTLAFGLVVLAWMALIATRIHYEEMVLETAFPEYAAYRQQVGRFAPRLFPAGTPQEQRRPLTQGLTGASHASHFRNR